MQSPNRPMLLKLASDMPSAAAVEGKKWVNYGEDNDFPEYLYELYRESPTHHALCNGIADMAYGDGFDSLTQDIVKRASIQDVFERSGRYRSGIDLIRKLTFDLKVYGRFYAHVIYALDRTVSEVHHYPFRTVRSGLRDDEGNVGTFWYSKDWSNVRKFKPEPIPCWKPGQSGIIAVDLFGSDDEYYPTPDYIGALRYVALEAKIGEFHLNNIENGLFPSFHIHHNNGIPDERTRTEIAREYEGSLAGAGNAGAFLLTFSDGTDRKTEMAPIQLSDADKQYQFLSEESQRKIFVGHRVTSPLLFGIRDSSGLGSNSDEMTQAMELLEKNVLKHYRQVLVEFLEDVFSTRFRFQPKGQPNEQPEPQTMAAARVQDDRPVLGDEAAEEVLAHLSEVAESRAKLEEDYRLIDSEYVDGVPLSDYEYSKQYRFTIDGRVPQEFGINPNPDPSSGLDRGFYRVRYRYVPGPGEPALKKTSRTFCRTMMNQFSGAIFRKEDIDIMSFTRANPEFGTYSIWRYKGSYNCRHRWERLVYFLKRVPAGRTVTIDGKTYKGGQFLPPTSIEHYRVVPDSQLPGTPPPDSEATRQNDPVR